ncbi:hypothetical protein H4Q26_006511 [Puccinia striiformis f. sp. tritici PST-130]|nr:hypothetical protein H4Q26_006511 [Puccinia striiformis f. sp. tritici PST-130]
MPFPLMHRDDSVEKHVALRNIFCRNLSVSSLVDHRKDELSQPVHHVYISSLAVVGIIRSPPISSSEPSSSFASSPVRLPYKESPIFPGFETDKYTKHCINPIDPATSSHFLQTSNTRCTIQSSLSRP